MVKLCLGAIILAITSLLLGAAVSVALNSIQLGEAASTGRVSNDCVPLSASGNNVYVAWVSNKTGNWEVMFRVSDDNGKTFSDKINLSNTPGSNSLDPHIAAYGDNVYISWHDNKTGNWDTYVRTSKDRGQTFGDTIAIKGTGDMPQTSKLGVPPGLDPVEDSPLEATHVAAFGKNVYVASWDKKTGNWEVFVARSTDNGDSFGDALNLSNSSNTRSDDAHIFALNDNVYTTWWETSKNGTSVPVFRASNDNGATFGPVLKLPANGPIGKE